jgi:hypothetical protein
LVQADWHRAGQPADSYRADRTLAQPAPSVPEIEDKSLKASPGGRIPKNSATGASGGAKTRGTMRRAVPNLHYRVLLISRLKRSISRLKRSIRSVQSEAFNQKYTASPSLAASQTARTSMSTTKLVSTAIINSPARTHTNSQLALRIPVPDVRSIRAVDPCCSRHHAVNGHHAIRMGAQVSHCMHSQHRGQSPHAQSAWGTVVCSVVLDVELRNSPVRLPVRMKLPIWSAHLKLLR